MKNAPLAALVLLGAGCATAPAVTPGVQLRLETRQECVEHCQAMGMRLSAVVLVRNSAGCVCSEPGAVSQVDGGGAAANAGAYLVALEEEEQRRQEAERHRTHQSSGPASPPPGSPSWHR